MSPDQKEALELRESGLSRVQIAQRMGRSVRQVKSLLEKARRWRDADPAAVGAATAAGSNSLPHSFWKKTDDYSVYYKVPQEDSQADLIDRVSEAFKDIPAYEAVPVDAVASDLLTVYPLMDAHFGMYAWSDETGGDDYDLDHAENDVKSAFGSLDLLTPRSGSALLILGGDTLHANDSRNETPKSKHKLDVDGRNFKVIDTAIRCISWIIEHLAYRHDKVTVRVLAGNHDPDAHHILTFALAERYRDISRIVIDKSPMDLLMFRHGTCLIAAHHGDKSPPQRLAMMIADVCSYWSEVRHRHILTGHIHHESAKDFPGIKWESLRAFCPPDAYGSGFAPRRALQAMVFSETKGRILVAHDPIERG